jgi:hypothetical protein
VFLFTIYNVTQIQQCILRQTVNTALRPLKSIYIAGLHCNSEHLLRYHYSDALLDVLRRVGREIVLVCVFEGGS